jgi:hypothetical protein
MWSTPPMVPLFIADKFTCGVVHISTFKPVRFEYIDSTGEGIIIQNSLPKGGVAINRGYTDSTGKIHGFGIFWTRVINETATPLELTINFPADSFAISSAPNSYFKLLLPPGTMTLDMQSLYNYGYEITDLRSFLDTSFNKPTMLHPGLSSD